MNLTKVAIGWGSGGDQPLGGAVMTLSPGKEGACRADSGPGSLLDLYVTYRISVEGLLLTLELRSMPTPKTGTVLGPAHAGKFFCKWR